MADSAAARPDDGPTDLIDEAVRERIASAAPLSEETRERLGGLLDQGASRRVGLAEAARYSGFSRDTLRRWIAEKRLPATRIGPQRIEVDLDDIDALRTPVPPGKLADAEAAQ